MRHRRPRLRPLLLLVSVLCIAAGCGDRPTVLLIGLDGADWDILDPLMEEGHTPTLANLVGEGARADFDCEPAWPIFSCYCPPVWVSIATGQPASVHGIRQIDAPSTARMAPALWDVLSEAGGRSVLAAYRNLEPAHEGDDFVITEHGMAWAAFNNFNRGEARDLEDKERFIQPPDMLEQLGLIPYTNGRPEVVFAAAQDRVTMEAIYRLANLSALGAFFGKQSPALTMFTLHAVDKVEHLTWPVVQPEPDDLVDRDVVLELAGAWDGPIMGTNLGDPTTQYLEADRWLGLLLESVHYDYVVIVSDHGMTRSRQEGLPGAHGPTSPEAHMGVFSIRGPGVVSGRVLTDVDVLDVAPTVAYVLGLPVADDLPGRVLLDAFSASWRVRHPVKTVPSW